MFWDSPLYQLLFTAAFTSTVNLCEKAFFKDNELSAYSLTTVFIGLLIGFVVIHDLVLLCVPEYNKDRMYTYYTLSQVGSLGLIDGFSIGLSASTLNAVVGYLLVSLSRCLDTVFIGGGEPVLFTE